MLIPESEGESLQFRLPLLVLKLVAALAVVASLAGIVLIGSYFAMLDDRAELYRLRQTNRLQRDQLEELQRRYAQLEDAWVRVEELDLQVREMLGLETKRSSAPETYRDARAAHHMLDASTYSAGSSGVGAGDLDPALLDLDRLDGLARSLTLDLQQTEASLAEVRAEVAEQEEALRSYPSLWPTRGLITSGYGYRRSPFGIGYEFHRGIDIAAPRGTAVVATADGIVTYVGWLSAYGITVRIDHGSDYETLYAHLGTAHVEPGQRVRQGETIGVVGSTGRSTGPHLHYEVYYLENTVNPRPYLVSRQP